MIFESTYIGEFNKDKTLVLQNTFVDTDLEKNQPAKATKAIEEDQSTEPEDYELTFQPKLFDGYILNHLDIRAQVSNLKNKPKSVAFQAARYYRIPGLKDMISVQYISNNKFIVCGWESNKKVSAVFDSTNETLDRLDENCKFAL